MSLGLIIQAKTGDSVMLESKRIVGSKSMRKGHVHFRIDEEARMRLNEVSAKSGVSLSALLRVSVYHLLDMLYDDDGYVNEDIIVNINALSDGIAPE